MTRRPDAYRPLSDRAKSFLRTRREIVAAWSGIGANSVRNWVYDLAAPRYEQVQPILVHSSADLDLRDFGFVELATGEVARLLALGHEPAPALYHRASGLAKCAACGLPYHRHPVDAKRRDSNGTTYLNILCDGRRVKL